jgi:hypothetical protein
LVGELLDVPAEASTRLELVEDIHIAVWGVVTPFTEPNASRRATP